MLEVTGDAVEVLRRRLREQDPERFPVQHATTCFHLGNALVDAGRAEEATQVLRTASSIFDGRLPLEYVKVLIALGVALRECGSTRDAIDAFEAAAARAREHGLAVEESIALFNDGVVLRQAGELPAAVERLSSCLELLGEEIHHRHAAAAARELGGALLQLGHVDESVVHLEAAIHLSDLAGDAIGAAAAANAFGIATLALDMPDRAVEAFSAALSVHPRSVRPAEFALAKSNLALAYEALGDLPRARLAARQALESPVRADAPAAQAAAVLERVAPAEGEGADDVLAVLDEERDEQVAAAIIREELVRLADAPLAVVRATADGLVHGLAARDERREGLLEAFLHGLLELPPTAMEWIVGALVDALDHAPDDAAEPVSSALERTFVRFPPPQATRLEHSFSAARSGA